VNSIVGKLLLFQANHWISTLIINSTISRVIGGILVLMGLIVTSNPEMLSDKPVPADTFEAIERRIWWGLIIGIGVLLILHHQLQPWLRTVAASLAALLFGMLVARLIGILLDGSVMKQWLYVGLELVILAGLMWWYRRFDKSDRHG